MVTGCELTEASGPQAADGTVGTDLLDRDDSIDAPVEVLGDSAYGTGDALNEIEKAGHTPLVKPWPTKPTKPTIAGGVGRTTRAAGRHAGVVKVHHTALPGSRRRVPHVVASSPTSSRPRPCSSSAVACRRRGM